MPRHFDEAGKWSFGPASAQDSKRFQHHVQRVLNPAFRVIIVGNGSNERAKAVHTECREVERVQDKTAPLNHKDWCNARMFASR